MERHDEVIGADEGDLPRPGVDARVAVAIVGHVNFHRRCTPSCPSAGGANGRREVAVEDLGMRSINASFQGLEPVALLNHLGDVTMRLRHLGPGEIGQWRLQRRWSHVGPDNAADLYRRIGSGIHLMLKTQFYWLVHHVDAAPVHVELPPVVHAAQATLLVTAQKQRDPPMRAVLLEEADTALRVPKGYQVFAQQPDAHWRAI